MRAFSKKHTLEFKIPSGTSRGVLTQKESWFIVVAHNAQFGIGECALLKGLSYDDEATYGQKIAWVCNNISLGEEKLLEATQDFPSIQFGIEQAFLSLKNDNPFLFFPSDFTANNRPIPINGLIWMGDRQFMFEQIKAKLESGFSCIKMKIGAIDFEVELDLLHYIRKHFSAADIELRVDANGAFEPSNALDKLKLLSELEIHSIEQPIPAKNWDAMAELCATSPLDIALDEELIGVFDPMVKTKLLESIRPQHIILKPSLLGGYAPSEEWISRAKNLKIGWWVTSALESCLLYTSDAADD